MKKKTNMKSKYDINIYIQVTGGITFGHMYKDGSRKLHNFYSFLIWYFGDHDNSPQANASYFHGNQFSILNKLVPTWRCLYRAS